MTLNINIRFIIGLLIGVLLITIWFAFFVEADEMAVYLKKINLWLTGLAVIFYVGAYLCRSRRWQIILYPVQPINYVDVTALFFSGMFINYLLPIRAGEVAKSVFLKKMKGTRMAKSLPTILLNKVIDLIPILLVLAMFPAMSIRTKGPILIMCGLLLLALIVLTLILVLSISNQQFTTRVLKKLLFWLPNQFKEKIFDFIDRFVVAIATINFSFTKWGQLLILTIFAVILDAAYLYTLFHAFGYSLRMEEALFGYTLMNLSYILPTPPAQIGSKELVALFIFSYGLGIEENLVGAVTAFSHLLTVFLICFLGVSSLSVIGIQLTELIRPLQENNNNDQHVAGDNDVSTKT